MFTILGLPAVFIFHAIFIDGMASLIFDCMDKPPFPSLRAKMCAAFFRTESGIISSLTVVNYGISLSVETIPNAFAITYSILLNHFCASNIVTG